MDLLKKYKIENFEEMVGHKNALKFFKNVVNDYVKYPSSFIVEGEYGIGKTSIVYAFSNEMKKKYKKNKVFFYEFDSSRLSKDNIKDLCNLIKNNFLFHKDNIYIILFEEIQSIVRKVTQDSLLKILEIKAKNIIFFFTTTEYNKIIDTIKSRSLTIRLNLLSDDEVKFFIDKIIDKENIEINEEDKNLIINYCSGHLRDCLQLLNLYRNDKDNFYNYVIDYKKILFDYLNNQINDEELYKYSVDKLLFFLYFVLKEYIDKIIIKDYERTIKILDIYFKYKNNVVNINDFILFIKMLKKAIWI